MASKKTLKPNIKPTAGHLLIEPIEAESKTEAGIYLPDTASEKTTKGEVVAVGADMENEQGKKISSPVKKGDIVIYKKWGGSEVKIGAKEFLFAKFEDILAIVEN
jgi:chaperonin GroES